MSKLFLTLAFWLFLTPCQINLKTSLKGAPFGSCLTVTGTPRTLFLLFSPVTVSVKGKCAVLKEFSDSQKSGCFYGPSVIITCPRNWWFSVGSEVRGQVREGLGLYFTLLKSSTVVSTGGVFQYSSIPNTRHRAMATICNTQTHTLGFYRPKNDTDDINKLLYNN